MTQQIFADGMTLADWAPPHLKLLEDETVIFSSSRHGEGAVHMRFLFQLGGGTRYVDGDFSRKMLSVLEGALIMREWMDLRRNIAARRLDAGEIEAP